MYSFWIKCANVNIVVYGNLMVESNLKQYHGVGVGVGVGVSVRVGVAQNVKVFGF